METIKQKTVDGVRYTLERAETDKFGKQYEYFVRAGKGQAARTKTFNPKQSYYRKREAMSAFNRIVSGKQESAGRNRSRSRNQSEESESRSGGLGLFGGNGGGQPQMPDFSGGAGGMPMLPGFGMQENDEDDEENTNQWPWM